MIENAGEGFTSKKKKEENLAEGTTFAATEKGSAESYKAALLGKGGVNDVSKKQLTEQQKTNNKLDDLIDAVGGNGFADQATGGIPSSSIAIA